MFFAVRNTAATTLPRSKGIHCLKLITPNYKTYTILRCCTIKVNRSSHRIIFEYYIFFSDKTGCDTRSKKLFENINISFKL